MTKNLKLPHVVIIGAGFGGLRAARALAKQPVQVTLIDRNNYHLFQPLLYQVATAGLSPDEIAYPIRAILRNQKNLTFLMDEVISIDRDLQEVETLNTSIDFDYLIVAVGSETNFFRNEEIQKNAFGLKDLQEAQAIRNHILRQFEAANIEENEQIRQALLTFVVVGGGPTGVEMAGAIAELLRVLKKDYHNIDHQQAQVILLEGLQRLLSHLSPASSEKTLRVLEKKGVQVRLGALVRTFDGNVITLNNNEQIQSKTLIWAAGVKTTALVKEFSGENTPQQRVKVLSTLQIAKNKNIFVIGDAAFFEDKNGQPLPMVAPVAMQQADLAVKNVMRLLHSKPLLPFEYRDMGSMATIGRNHAVAELFGVRLSGWIAWLVWLFVHLMQLVGFRNRLVVLINWAWQYLFYDRAVRLIEKNDCLNK
jgi:NADH dehydrogenase